jgi:predicted RNA binding protein YcfA (HicA-like mRNA interferase family)
MKRTELLRHLANAGCVLKREGASHSIWHNPATRRMQAIPRHKEIADKLACKIIRALCNE